MSIRNDASRDVDRHLGSRVRIGRKMRGITQPELAQMLGFSFQQMHKYEYGVTRLPASRLHEISQILKLPIEWFFEGLNEPIADTEEFPRQSGVQLLQLWTRIKGDHRRMFLVLLEALAVKV